MDIYASDDEKSEAIKRWWRENGSSVVIGVVLGVAAIIGGRYWLTYQAAQSESAAMLYQQSLVTLNSGDMALAETSTNQLMTDYSRSAYATFAAMELAAGFAADQQTESASEYLQWAVDNAKLPAQKELARVRLARLKADIGDYQDALQLLDQSSDVGFASLIAELKGDILTLQGETQQARAAYQTAIADLQAGDPRQGLLEMKRDDVASTDAH